MKQSQRSVQLAPAWPPGCSQSWLKPREQKSFHQFRPMNPDLRLRPTKMLLFKSRQMSPVSSSSKLVRTAKITSGIPATTKASILITST